MSVDTNLVEQLLHEDESPSLDFKRDQYKFSGADNNTKSELLKDILAFSNSWRRSTAYILIGVSERRGGRCDVVGVAEHLDDADVQQFVNSKTQRPVTFSYRHVLIDEKEIGLLAIPLQDRPIFLRKNFGRLKKDTVYIRRGSSTAKANPEEISSIGRAVVTDSTPHLQLEWGNLDQRRCLSQTCTIHSVVLHPDLPASIIEMPRPDLGIYASWQNQNYASELIEYVHAMAFWSSQGFCLKNKGETVGSRIRFVGSILKTTGIQFLDWSDRRGKPDRTSIPVVEGIRSLLDKGPNPDVRNLDDRTELTIDFGDVRPGDDVWTICPVLIGTLSNGTSTLQGELRG